MFEIRLMGLNHPTKVWYAPCENTPTSYNGHLNIAILAYLVSNNFLHLVETGGSG